MISMNKTLKYVGLFAILPLFTMALTTDYVIEEADAATKSKGSDAPGRTGAGSFGSANKFVVCGDRLCSEYPGGYEQFKKDQGESAKIGAEAVEPTAPTPEPTPAPEPEPEISMEIPKGESFSLSSSLDDNSYMIVGNAKTAMPLAFTINPHESVQIDLTGGEGGEMEITLPKKMISGIHTVKSGDNEILFQQMATTDTTTTLKFTVPDDTSSIEIVGANVVPEFSVVIGILAGALVMIVVFMRAKTHFILYQ